MIWRKTAFVMVLISMAHLAQAQIPKGTIMAGGSVGFQFATNNSTSGSYVSFNFAPQIGGFVGKNFVLGVTPIFRYNQQTDNVSGSHFHSQFSFGLGPFLRYYVKIAPKFYFYAHLVPVSVSAEWERYYRDPNQPYSKNLAVNWVVGPGFSVMLSKTVAIEPSIYYNGIWHQSAIIQNGNLLSESKPYMDHGMVFNIGLQVYFERIKKDKESPK